jgi:O-antigen/teichoic acid export membrane protein
MTRTRRFIGGAGVGYVYQAVVAVAGLWLTPFLLRRLGQQEYGLWLTGAQVLAYLALLDLGVVALLPRETAYAAAERPGDPAATELPALVGRIAHLVLWQMPVVAVVAFAVWYEVPTEWAPLRQPLGLVLTAFVLTFPLRIFQGVLLGLQDLTFLSTLQLVCWTGGTLLTVALVVSGWGLQALAAGGVLIQFVPLAACWWRLQARFPGALPRGLPGWNWPQSLPHVRRAGWMSLQKLAHLMINGADVLIVAKVFGPAAVVPYGCTQKLIAVLANQPQLLTETALPAMSELKVGATREKRLTVSSALVLAMLLSSGAVFSVILAVNRTFVTWWVGPSQYAGATLSVALLLTMVMRHWNTALAYSLLSFGYERRLSLTTLVDAVVSVAAALVFVQIVGLAGVPIGLLTGVLLVSLPANLSALATESGVSVLALLGGLKAWAIRIAIVAAFAAGTSLLSFAPTVTSLVFITAGVGVAYVLVAGPLAIRPPLEVYVRPILGRFRGLLNLVSFSSGPLVVSGTPNDQLNK